MIHLFGRFENEFSSIWKVIFCLQLQTGAGDFFRVHVKWYIWILSNFCCIENVFNFSILNRTFVFLFNVSDILRRNKILIISPFLTITSYKYLKLENTFRNGQKSKTYSVYRSEIYSLGRDQLALVYNGNVLCLIGIPDAIWKISDRIHYRQIMWPFSVSFCKRNSRFKE